MSFNAIPSAVVSASANTGGVPVGREDDAATADVVVVKLKQPLSPAEMNLNSNSNSIFIFWFSLFIQLNLYVLVLVVMKTSLLPELLQF